MLSPICSLLIPPKPSTSPTPSPPPSPPPLVQVHSLATVISAKLELPSNVWAVDPQGQAVARAINSHLPPSIRVFGVLPVQK